LNLLSRKSDKPPVIVLEEGVEQSFSCSRREAATGDRVICEAKVIRSRLAVGEIRISNIEIRNKFEARISNAQNCHAGVWVIPTSILFRASDFEFRIFLSLGRSP